MKALLRRRRYERHLLSRGLWRDCTFEDSKEPPRDYVEHHKLSPNDNKHELRRYGYRNSPSAKSYALAEVIEKRYSNKNIKKLQVVESPLNKLNVNKTVRAGAPLPRSAEKFDLHSSTG